MAAISPRLLLEIQPAIFRLKNVQSKKITPCKLAEFRKRTIANTFREIIFGDRAVLEYWQGTTEFRNRVALMKDFTSYNRLVEVEGSKVLRELNAFRNRA